MSDFDGGNTQAIEQAHTATQHDRRYIQVDFVQQTGLDALLGDIRTRYRYVLIAGSGFCLLSRTT